MHGHLDVKLKNSKVNMSCIS